MEVNITRIKREYFACSGCRNEFFSREEYNNHPCMKRNRNFDPNGLLSSMPSCERMTDSMKFGRNFMEAEGSSKGGGNVSKGGGNVMDNTGSSDSVDPFQVDVRLDKLKKVDSMKQELFMAGIEAQTLDEAATIDAYNKFKGIQVDKDEARQSCARKRKRHAE